MLGSSLGLVLLAELLLVLSVELLHLAVLRRVNLLLLAELLGRSDLEVLVDQADAVYIATCFIC